MAYSISTPIASLTALIAMDCPGAPSFLKEQAIRQAAIEFFTQTRAWREVITDITLIPGDSEINANALAQRVSRHAVCLEINDMWLSEDTTRLQKLSRESLDKNKSGWRDDTADEPSGFFMTPQRKIRIYPKMADDADDVDVDAELVLVSTMETETFPDFLYDFYAETIAAAASWRLLLQPGREWSSKTRAAVFLKKAATGMNIARTEQARRAVEALNSRTRRYYR